MPHSLLCWKVGANSYCYTPHKQFVSDGKFHAMKYRGDKLIKDITFRKRKIAKARAYKWYNQHRERVKQRPKKDTNQREIRSLAKKLEKTKTFLKQLETSEISLQDQVRYWSKELNRRKTQLKRMRKALRKTRRLEQQLSELLKAKMPNLDGRVAAIKDEI